MARGEIIRKLFKGFSQNNREEFYAAAMELIQEERDKNHTLLAKDLEKYYKLLLIKQLLIILLGMFILMYQRIKIADYL